MEGRVGVDLDFDFYGFIGLEGDVVDLGVVFEESRLDSAKAFFVFLGYLDVAVECGELVDEGLEVLGEVEVFVGLQE